MMRCLFRVTLLFICLLYTFTPSESIGVEVHEKKIIGTHYTGSTWAPSFWSNLNIHDVHDDLLEIKENGFNAIIIIIPWVGFQVSVDPVRYFEDYFELLDGIIRIAQQIDLDIIFRVGYVHEIGVSSVPSNYERIINLLTDETTLNAWEDYLHRLYKTASKYDNFLFGFITWEDFFLLDFARLRIDQRTELSSKTGYQEYLRKYPLEKISGIYRKEFSSYSEIPIPSYDSSGLPLFYEFWDQVLMRIYKQSKRCFPKLSMEVRIDCDPADKDRTEYVCHESTFDLAGEGDITVIYYSPAWGARNVGDQATANDALLRFQLLLKRVRSHTNNLIFIDQFNFVDNTIGFEGNTKIVPGEVPAFIDGCVSAIEDKTIGYALWAMKDIRCNVIINGSFERGDLGWDISKGRLLTDEGDRGRSILIEDQGRITQVVRCGSYVSPPKKRQIGYFRLRFNANKAESRPANLTIRIAGQRGRLLQQKQVLISYDDCRTVDIGKIPSFSDGMISIQNSGASVVVDDVVLFYRVQGNGVYDVFGAPKYFRDNIIAMNRALSAEEGTLEYYDNKAIKMASIEGYYDDGWANRLISGEILVPSNNRRCNFVVETYVPPTWKSYTNGLTVEINDKVIGASAITQGYNKVRFSIETEALKGRTLPFKIVPDRVYSPTVFEPTTNDKRMLSFVLVGFGFAE